MAICFVVVEKLGVMLVSQYLCMPIEQYWLILIQAHKPMKTQHHAIITNQTP